MPCLNLVSQDSAPCRLHNAAGQSTLANNAPKESQQPQHSQANSEAMLCKPTALNTIQQLTGVGIVVLCLSGLLLPTQAMAQNSMEDSTAASESSANIATPAPTTLEIDQAIKDGKVTFEYCQQTDKLNQILDKIPKDDVNSLLKFKGYLVECQSLIAANQKELEAKQAQAKESEGFFSKLLKKFSS